MVFSIDLVEANEQDVDVNKNAITEVSMNLDKHTSIPWRSQGKP